MTDLIWLNKEWNVPRWLRHENNFLWFLNGSKSKQKRIMNQLLWWFDHTNSTLDFSGDAFLSPVSLESYLYVLLKKKRDIIWNNTLSRIKFEDLNFQVVGEQKQMLLDCLDTIHANFPSVTIDFSWSAQIDDDTLKQVLQRIPQENIAWLPIPDHLWSKWYDLKEISKIIFEIWMNTWHDLFLDMNLRNWDIKPELYKLLKHSWHDDTYMFNQHLKQSIDNLSSDDIQKVVLLINQIKQVQASFPNLDQVVEDKRITVEERGFILETNAKIDQRDALIQENAEYTEQLEEEENILQELVEKENLFLETPVHTLVSDTFNSKLSIVDALVKRIDMKTQRIQEQQKILQSDIDELSWSLQVLDSRNVSKEAEILISDKIRLLEEKMANLQKEINNIETSITRDEESRDVKSALASQKQWPERKSLNQEIGASKRRIEKNSTLLEEKNNLYKQYEQQKNDIQNKQSIYEKELTEEINQAKIPLEDRKVNLDTQMSAIENDLNLLDSEKKEYELMKKSIVLLIDTVEQQDDDVSFEDIESLLQGHKFHEDIRTAYVAKAQEKLVEYFDTIREEYDVYKEAKSQNVSDIQRYRELEGDYQNEISWLNEQNEFLAKKVNEFVELIRDPIEQNYQEGVFSTIRNNTFQYFEPSEIEDIISGIKSIIGSQTQVDMYLDKVAEAIQSKISANNVSISTKEWQIQYLNEQIEELKQEDKNRLSPRGQSQKEVVMSLQQSIDVNDAHIQSLNQDINQERYDTLTQKRDTEEHDLQIKAELLLTKVDELLAAWDQDFIAALDAFADVYNDIQINTTASFEPSQVRKFNLAKFFQEIQTWTPEISFWKIVEKLLDYFFLATSVVWTWVWIGQLYQKLASQAELLQSDSDIPSIIVMLIGWWLLGWVWYHYGYKENIKKRIKEWWIRKFLKNGKKLALKMNRPRLILAYMFLATIIFADSSWLWTLFKWWEKRAQEMHQLMWLQEDFSDWLLDMWIRWEDIVTENYAAVIDILTKEKDGDLYTKWWEKVAPWKWPNYVAEVLFFLGEEYLAEEVKKNPSNPKHRDYISQESIVSWRRKAQALAEQYGLELWALTKINESLIEGIKWVQLSPISVAWETTEWSDAPEAISSLWDGWHGAKAVLPSTTRLSIDAIEQTGDVAEITMEQMADLLYEYSEQVEKILEASAWWTQIESQISLETVSSEDIDGFVEKWWEALKSYLEALWNIEYYTDIFSMFKFVAQNEWLKNALWFLSVILLTLFVAHSVTPTIRLFRTHKIVARRRRELEAKWSKALGFLDNFVQNFYPSLLMTSAWESSLAEDDHIVLAKRKAMISELMDYDLKSWVIDQAQVDDIKDEIESIFSWQWIELLKSITAATWKEVDAETWNLMWAKPSVIFKNYFDSIENMYDIDTLVTNQFFVTLYQKSPAFRKKVYQYHWSTTEVFEKKKRPTHPENPW